MPRQSRIDAPGALHHVLIRGIERRKIFQDDADRENFLDRLGRILTETSTGCYGWALLSKHVHLLLRTGTAPIATVMARLLTGYVVSFNRRHRRHGISSRTATSPFSARRTLTCCNWSATST